MTNPSHTELAAPCVDHGQKGCPFGYGSRTIGRKKYRLHRFVYAEHHGIGISDIDGLVIRHACDNPRCINPDHLVPGTIADNNRDMSIRRRHAKMKLTNEQVAEIRATCVPSRSGINTGSPTTYCGFARRFGVDPGTVRNVYLRRSFKHLP